jgi:YD repeat-containing protein
MNETSFTQPSYLSSGADSSNGYLTSVWTEGTASPYTIMFSSLPVPLQVWSPYSDPWDQEGVIPYGAYYQNLQEYVSTFNGLLTLTGTDFSLPGRGFGDVGGFTFTRVFRTLYGTPYTFENYPYVNFGVGWSLDWPWMGSNYLHLHNGQGYLITFVNNKFENHQGEQFTLTQNSDGTYTLTDQAGNVYVFNSSKQLEYIYDRTLNNTVTFSWSNAANGQSTITDSVGRTITLTNDANGRVETVNADGRIWTYAYNSNGDLISVKDPVGRVTSYQYASQYGPSYLTQVTYPTGAYTTYTYAYATQLGTEAKPLRVNQQSVYLKGGTLVRQQTFSYTANVASSISTTTITFSDGTSVQGYSNYQFTPTNVTITTENSQAQAIRQVINLYNQNGQVSEEIVYPSGSGSSYTNYYNYD